MGSTDRRSEVSRGRPPARAKTPKRARSTSLRDELLDSTTAIIREKGLAFVSLRAVARRASASHGAPAYHFRSKAGLLTAYATNGYVALVELVGERVAAAGPDPRLQLQASGRAYVEFAVANPEQFEIMFRGELHEANNAELKAASDRAIGVLGGIIKRCVEAGCLAPKNVQTTVAAAWSLTHGLAMLWLQGRLPARLEERDPIRLTGAVVELFVMSSMPTAPTAPTSMAIPVSAPGASSPPVSPSPMPAEPSPRKRTRRTR